MRGTPVPRRASPLRYPGGKGRMAPWFAALLAANRITGTYVEPFTGGAGTGAGLLLSGRVERIVINDLDAGVYAFWHTLVTRPGTLVRAVRDIPFDCATGIRRIGPAGARRYWRDVHERYRRGVYRSEASRARDFLLLDRMNRSGITGGGPIGGAAQDGPYNISSRFGKSTLIRRIENLADARDRITVTRLEASRLLARLDRFGDPGNMLIYADPPYYAQGRRLYDTCEGDRTRALLAARLLSADSWRWVLTYDEAPLIDGFYPSGACDRYEYVLGYCASRHAPARERMYTSRGLLVPSAHGISPCPRPSCAR